MHATAQHTHTHTNHVKNKAIQILKLFRPIPPITKCIYSACIQFSTRHLWMRRHFEFQINIWFATLECNIVKDFIIIWAFERIFSFAELIVCLFVYNTYLYMQNSYWACSLRVKLWICRLDMILEAKQNKKRNNTKLNYILLANTHILAIALAAILFECSSLALSLPPSFSPLPPFRSVFQLSLWFRLCI